MILPTAKPYSPNYPDDVLKILTVDELGYPSRMQLTLVSSGRTHLLDADYDQTGALISVRWVSGYLEGFKDGFETTQQELHIDLSEDELSEEDFWRVISASSQQGLIAGTVREFLRASSEPLIVGSEIRGEVLNQAWAANLDQGASSAYRSRRKSDADSSANTPCLNPLTDCDELRRVNDYAEVAGCAYTDSPCHTRFFEANLDTLGITLEDLHKASFHAEIYYDKELDEYIVTFAGTKMFSPSDWFNNVQQELALDSFQYQKALNLSMLISGLNPQKTFKFTGHSLGGGLATAAAAVIDADAIVFNAAGLDLEYAEKHAVDYANAEANTVNYSVHGEILAHVQATTDSISAPPGIVHSLPRPNFAWVQETVDRYGLFPYSTRLGAALHSMDAVKQSIADQMQMYHCI